MSLNYRFIDFQWEKINRKYFCERLFFASIAQCQVKIFASRNKVHLISSSPHIPSFPGKSSSLLSDIQSTNWSKEKFIYTSTRIYINRPRHKMLIQCVWIRTEMLCHRLCHFTPEHKLCCVIGHRYIFMYIYIHIDIKC